MIEFTGRSHSPERAKQERKETYLSVRNTLLSLNTAFESAMPMGQGLGCGTT